MLKLLGFVTASYKEGLLIFLEIFIRVLELENLASLDQFTDAFIDCFRGFKAEGVNLFMQDAVVSFVFILADIGEMEVIIDSIFYF